MTTRKPIVILTSAISFCIAITVGAQPIKDSDAKAAAGLTSDAVTTWNKTFGAGNKAIDKTMVIEGVRLLRKTGGTKG